MSLFKKSFIFSLVGCYDRIFWLNIFFISKLFFKICIVVIIINDCS